MCKYFLFRFFVCNLKKIAGQFPSSLLHFDFPASYCRIWLSARLLYIEPESVFRISRRLLRYTYLLSSPGCRYYTYWIRFERKLKGGVRICGFSKLRRIGKKWEKGEEKENEAMIDDNDQIIEYKYLLG